MATSWRVARSLEMLLWQINAAYPSRSKASDGSIGDAAHSSRSSDHNPDADRVVRARDFTHDPGAGFDAHAFAERLRLARDPRIKYVISDRRIFSGNAGPSPWTWRRYTGINPHTKHVHVSVVADEVADTTHAWSGVTGTSTAGSRIPDLPNPAPAPEDWLMALSEPEQERLLRNTDHLIAMFPSLERFVEMVWATPVPASASLAGVAPDAWLRDARLAAGMAYTAALQAGDVDEAALAAQVAPLLAPAVISAVGERAELTEDDVEDAIRRVLGSLAPKES